MRHIYRICHSTILQRSKQINGKLMNKENLKVFQLTKALIQHTSNFNSLIQISI